jgi:hypothetical protein
MAFYPFIILLLSLLFIAISSLKLRFFHCYQAGIYFARAIGGRYINAEEIEDISFQSIYFITTVKIKLTDSKPFTFYYWRVNMATQGAIKMLYGFSEDDGLEAQLKHSKSSG